MEVRTFHTYEIETVDIKQSFPSSQLRICNTTAQDNGLRKRQNPSAVPEDAAVLRHQPHVITWEFGTQDTGVTGLIASFVSTTVLLHLLPSCVIYLLGKWRGQSGPGKQLGSKGSALVALGCRRRMRWRHSPLPQEDANKYPNRHPALCLPLRWEFLQELGKCHSVTKFFGKAGGQKRHLPPFEALKPQRPLCQQNVNGIIEWFVGLG